jgi:two-component system, CitB family, response regulator DctR
MADWRVLVVEDDPVVARLHCRFVSRVRGFAPVGVASSAVRAHEMVRTLQPHLVLLDIGLPGQSGLILLRRLRADAVPVEAILVTAATAATTVHAAVQLGAVDYLVKPFDEERLRKSLRLFERRMAMLGGAQLTQGEVDELCSNGPNALRWLPRTISRSRLEEVRAVLSREARHLTAEEVAAETGVARVTARRYLEYLVTIGQATMEPLVTGPGRPRHAYAAVSTPLESIARTE